MKNTLIIFLISILIFACVQKQADKKSVDEKFESFLFKFNNDSVFQINRIKFPLSSIEVESDNFTEVHRKIEKRDFKGIDLTFDKVDQKREGYTKQIKLQKDKATIELQGIENGIMESYYFEKLNGKWMLTGWIDSST